MSKRSTRSKKAARSQKPTQPPWLIPAVIAGAGVLLFFALSQLVRGGPTGSGVRLVGTKQYAEAPPMLIDPAKTYTATIRTEKGDVVIQLFPDKAPITVNSFVFLAREGYFDGVTFHRVLPDFMAQGGDPTGTGTGGPGYRFVSEISDLTFDKEGVVAMANSGPDTNGSQFFITYAPVERLNGGYTIFGQVTSGMDVVRALTPRDPQENPVEPGDTIETVFIAEQ
jgi:cyclophilin family peptidyl-prolyl cis-trans isomerase